MTMGIDVSNLGELCLAGAEKYKSRKALELCRGDRLLQTVSFRALAFRSRQLAGLFRSLGLGRGSRIMLLAENRPEWPAAVFGAALAGAVLLPVDPRLPSEGGRYFRRLGEGAAVQALCVTQETAESAAALDRALPRIFLDSLLPAAGRGQHWISVRVSAGGVSKRLPLAWTGETLPKAETDSAAVIWPDGTESSHRELLSLASGGPARPRIFPRDRIVSVSSLAEKGALVLGVLAAVLGGASQSFTLPPGEAADPPGPRAAPHILELLRPTVMIGDGAFLEALYRGEGAVEGPWPRNAAARLLARYLGGRRLMKALGGNVRFFGLTAGPDLGAETAKALSGVHLPRGRIVPS
jgi:long-chain acyl-CoA synthetase